MKKTNNTVRFIKAGLFSAAFSLVLLVLTYFYWNRSYTYGYGDDLVLKVSMVRDFLGPRKFDDSNIVSVNVGYDKVFVPHINPRDSTESGVIPITDRGKLLALLQMLKSRDAYRYIVCDVNFDNYSTEYDDELFSTIASMRDIVVASSDRACVPEQIRDKVAMSKYSVRRVGESFLKYEYILPDGEPNLALRIWEDLTGGEMKKTWWGYSINGKPCVRANIPDFRYSIYDDISQTDVDKVDGPYKYLPKIYDMGAHVVDPYLAGETTGKFYDGKLILVGDFVGGDSHATISGMQPGLLIIFNAFLSLLHGDNVVPFWVYLLLFLVFWVESLILFRNKFGLDFKRIRMVRKLRVWFYRKRNAVSEKVSAANKSRARRKFIRSEDLRKALKLMLDLVEYVTPLWVLALFVYAVSGVFVNVLVIGSVFWFISLFV